MFRHKNTVEQKVTENKKMVDEKNLPLENTKDEAPLVVEKKSPPKTDTEVLKELLEKNLKWSQIIYEQNRKINNKLMWSSIANWFRIFLIVIPLILAILFLPPIVQNLFNTYSGLLGGKINSNNVAPSINSIDQLLKTLPIDPAKQEQLKALLK